MQGFTLPAGTVDLNLGPRADPVTGYVAMSRFKRADDVLILQPFDLSVFQQGVAEEANLLLEHLRGNDINIAVQEKEKRDKVNEENRKRKLKEARAQRLAETQEAMTPEAKKRKSGEGKTRGPYKTVARTLCTLCTLCGAEKGRTDFPWRTWGERDLRRASGRPVLCKACVAAEKSGRQ